MDAVTRNRWERKRKLLPTLKLRYPGSDELAEIASLANVEESRRETYGKSIPGIILDSHLNTVSFQGQSIPEVKRILRSLGTKSLDLRRALKDVDVDLNTAVASSGTKQHAGMSLELELGKYQISEKLMLIPEYVERLTALSDASLQAAASLKATRGPRGTAGGRAFPMFVESMVLTAWMHGGNWTNYQAANGSFQGSFIKAIKLLERYLPRKFLPHGDLGRAVAHIQDRLHKRITKNRHPEA
jgi:hypothetical protein